MSDVPLNPETSPLRKRTNSTSLLVVDWLTEKAAVGGTLLLIGSLILLIVTITIGAWPSIHEFGFKFLYTSVWDPAIKMQFGAWPYIYTTVTTSVVSLVIAIPVSVGSAIFLSKLAPKVRIPIPAKLVGSDSPSGWVLLNPRYFVTITSFLIELLAAIPSIAYGLWGVIVLVPFMQKNIMPVLTHTIGAIPGIGFWFSNKASDGTPLASGANIFTSSVVLAIMVIPIMTAIVRDVLVVVPPELEQGALGLGATWWQAMRLVLGFAKMGIFGAVVLGFARAMGETMAVTMIIGNARPNGWSLFSPGQSIASLLANQFNNADTDNELQALFYVALVLLLITMIVNGIARAILLKVTMSSTTKPKKKETLAALPIPH